MNNAIPQSTHVVNSYYSRTSAIPYYFGFAFTSVCCLTWYAAPLVPSYQSVIAAAVALFLYVFQSSVCIRYDNWAPMIIFLGCIMVIPPPTTFVLLLPHGLFFLTFLQLGKYYGWQRIHHDNGVLRLSSGLYVFGFFTSFFYAGQGQIAVIDNCTPLLRILTVIAVFPAVCSIIDSKQDRRRIFIFLSAFTALQWSAFVLMMRSQGMRFALGDQEANFDIGGLSFSFTSTFLGPAISVAASAIIGYGLSSRSKLSRYFFTGLGFFHILTAAITGARGALISFFVVLLTACWIMTVFVKGRSRGGMYSLMVISLLVLALFYSGAEYFNNIIHVLTTRYNDFSQSGQEYSRWIRWDWASRQVLQEPLGVGWTLAPIGKTNHAHNDLLIFSMSYGIAGGLAYLLLIGTTIRNAFRGIHYSDAIERQLSFAGFCLIVAIVMNGMGDMLIVVGHMFELSWLLVFIAYGYRHQFVPHTTTESRAFHGTHATTLFRRMDRMIG